MDIIGLVSPEEPLFTSTAVSAFFDHPADVVLLHDRDVTSTGVQAWAGHEERLVSDPRFAEFYDEIGSLPFTTSQRLVLFGRR
ncbi:MAG TPA: hypothetical protein VGR26_18710 [Acidimicrobiales bacterium]|nr:hypothetical protein [Acidimicrobiales bacterium]